VKAFRSLTARAAVLDRADVDTDQIVPKQFLKRIERTGYGEFLFYDWRQDPAFELNRGEAKGARILLTGRNFGCGSSREHAVWALQDYGFEVVVAPSFADIFLSNALQSGLVPVRLPAPDVKALMEGAGSGELTVDLEQKAITEPDGTVWPFEFDPFQRHCLLHGLDAIARTLERERAIAAFEAAHPSPIATTLVAGRRQ
jgi:3-isopropylmalate/(R)-2-methylmalate dehydratase small subunit